MGARGALLFELPETSYLVAFTYVALSSALATGVVLEYRMLNPFGTYLEAEDAAHFRKRPRSVDVLQTCAVSFIATMLVLVSLYRLFALGRSMVAPPGATST